MSPGDFRHQFNQCQLEVDVLLSPSWAAPSSAAPVLPVPMCTGCDARGTGAAPSSTKICSKTDTLKN